MFRGGGGEVRSHDPRQNYSQTSLIQLDVRDVMTTVRTRFYMSQHTLTSVQIFIGLMVLIARMSGGYSRVFFQNSFNQNLIPDKLLRPMKQHLPKEENVFVQVCCGFTINLVHYHYCCCIAFAVTFIKLIQSIHSTIFDCTYCLLHCASYIHACLILYIT